MDKTISHYLVGSAVDLATLRRRYSPLLALVEQLIGVIPNCDGLLEIWPVGFRSYNLLVPTFFNLPVGLFGGGLSQRSLGIALYHASRSAQCPYCTAHTCAYALRRGNRAEALFSPVGPKDRAIAAAAGAVATFPCVLARSHVAELEQHLTASEVEWFALGASAMGFLNKFMDASGVQLEDESLAMVGSLLARTGWVPGRSRALATGVARTDDAGSAAIGGSGVGAGGAPVGMLGDSPRALLRVLRHAPAAAAMELRWTFGVPSNWPKSGRYLEARTGHAFPVLRRLSHARPARALVTVLRDNLDPRTTRLGLGTKCLVGAVYAAVAGAPSLARAARDIAARHARLDVATFAGVERFALQPAGSADARREQAAALGLLPGLSSRDAVALALARAASSSPAEIDDGLAAEAVAALGAGATVELLVWLAIQQLLHRLDCVLSLRDGAASLGAESPVFAG